MCCLRLLDTGHWRIGVRRVYGTKVSLLMIRNGRNVVRLIRLSTVLIVFMGIRMAVAGMWAWS